MHIIPKDRASQVHRMKKIVKPYQLYTKIHSILHHFQDTPACRHIYIYIERERERERERVVYQGNETEEKVFRKGKVFNEDLKELTEVE